MERFRGAYVDKDEELVPAVIYISGAAIIGSFLAHRSKLFIPPADNNFTWVSHLATSHN